MTWRFRVDRVVRSSFLGDVPGVSLTAVRATRRGAESESPRDFEAFRGTDSWLTPRNRFAGSGLPVGAEGRVCVERQRSASVARATCSAHRGPQPELVVHATGIVYAERLRTNPGSANAKLRLRGRRPSIAPPGAARQQHFLLCGRRVSNRFSHRPGEFPSSERRCSSPWMRGPGLRAPFRWTSPPGTARGWYPSC